MSGLDDLQHSRNLTYDTYCDSFPCIGSIAEPTTMITDYILTIELLIVGGLLLRFCSETPAWALYWASGFMLLGVSFAFGGSEHGFALTMKCAGRAVCIESSWLWVVTLLTQTPGLALPVIGATYLAFSSVCIETRPKMVLAAKVYAVLIVLVFSVLAIVGAVATPAGGFLVGFLIVIIFSVPSVLLVLICLSLPVCCCRSDKPSCGQITTLVGWIVSIISIAWQATGVGIHEHFNHNDIFHTIFIIGVAITYAGLAPQLMSAVKARAAPNEWPTELVAHKNAA